MLTRGGFKKFFQTEILVWVRRRWVVVKLRTAAVVAIALVALGYLLGRL